MVDMDATHLLSERPWQFDVDATHRGLLNQYIILVNDSPVMQNILMQNSPIY